MHSEALARRGGNAWDCDDTFEDCDEDDSPKKPITVLDEKTGLMVIERESDSEWNQSPEPKLPFSQIIKLTSSFDGNSEYAVFDKNWRKAYPNEYGVVTKWTPDFVQGVSYVKQDAACCLARSASWLQAEIFHHRLKSKLAHRLIHFTEMKGNSFFPIKLSRKFRRNLLPAFRSELKRRLCQ